jgi:DNA-binding GntR family transcriptional regulator
VATDFGLTLDARPERLTELVYEAVRRAIIERVIPPGARVTEAGLAAQLGVSKTPAREALLRLRQVGVIELDGPRSLRVVQPCCEAVESAYETREALEVFTARKAAERHGGAELPTIALSAARSLSAAQEGALDAFRTWDAEFHQAIARAAANERVARMIGDVSTLILTLRERDVPRDGASVECGHAHVRIAEAIERGDMAAAEAEMRAHLRAVAGAVLAAVAANAV